MSQAQIGSSSRFATGVFRQELSMTLRGTVTTLVCPSPSGSDATPLGFAPRPLAAAFQSLIHICIFHHQIRHHWCEYEVCFNPEVGLSSPDQLVFCQNKERLPCLYLWCSLHFCVFVGRLACFHLSQLSRNMREA